MINNTPWVVGEGYEQNDPGIYITDSTGCVVLSDDVPLTKDIADDIVARVNACSDADTETLVAIANGEMDGSEIWELAKVKQQRDVLLAAIKTHKSELLTTHEDCAVGHYDTALWDKADAIAKAGEA